MSHGTADKLVFCHEAMHVQLRMQDAGWSADVERWEGTQERLLCVLFVHRVHP